MSPQSDMAERVYDRLAQSDVSAAELVEELRANWVQSTVHGKCMVLSTRLRLVSFTTTTSRLATSGMVTLPDGDSSRGRHTPS